MKALLCLPPARISNELDLFRAMPDWELTVVTDRERVSADRSIRLAPRRVPVVGGHEGWTAAPAWLRGLTRLQPGPVDVVVSLELFSFGSLQASGLARRLGVPHVVTIFETLADNPLYRVPPWRQITRRVVSTAAGFVCFTRRAAAHAVLLGCPEQRCVVVHPGVDTARFFPTGDVDSRRPVVLFVGMLRADRGADKGVLDVVDACARLQRDGARLRLVLIGEGPLGPALVQRAVKQPFLQVLGRRPRDEVAQLMRQAGTLVLASRRTAKWEEQFGFVLAEAMAAGLPVVATRSGAIPEVVPDWNPLVDEGDVESLAEGIRLALGPKGSQWGCRNRRYVEEHLELRKQGAALSEALRGIIAAWTPLPATSRPRPANG